MASCAGRFPYSPEKFLENLLVVAGESDVTAVPTAFERVFATKLRKTPLLYDSGSFTYGITGCEWYSDVLISRTHNPKISHGILTEVRIGHFPGALLFAGPQWGECLTIESADKSLTTSGWKGGLVPAGEAVMWEYRTSHAKVVLRTGQDVKPGSRCISVVYLGFY